MASTTTTTMTAPVLENGLRQRLILMENAAARIANTKTQLRQNADQISNTISHQLACIRSREQELVSNLDAVVSLKERLLSDHQEQLHQAIGACQHGLQCVLRNGEKDPVDVQEMLFRLNTVDLRVRENSHVAFEADTLELRHAVAEFGRIVCDHRFPANESLPLELEEYEDDDLLQHKSIMRPGGPFLGANMGCSPTRLPRTSRDQRIMRNAVTGSHGDNNVGTWLRHIKSNCEQEPTLFEDFEIIRDRAASVTNSNSTSMDTNKSESDIARLFVTHFNSVLKSPSETWLLQPQPVKVDKVTLLPKQFRDTTTTNGTTDVVKFVRLTDSMNALNLAEQGKNEEMPANAKKRRPVAIRNESCDTVSSDQIDGDCFNVIARIKRSDNVNWLASSNDQTPDTSIEISKQLTSLNGDGSDKLDNTWPPSFDYHWLQGTATDNGDRISNESAQKVATWESILGWQAILERIHASGDDEWLAPSSRQL